MKKRILSFALALVMMASLSVGAFAAEGMSNFRVKNVYTPGQFTDVKAGEWYESYVASAYRLGLLEGVDVHEFGIDGKVTLAQAITMAARLNSIYRTGSADFVQGDPWYQVYVDYCTKNGIVKTTYPDYYRAATRAECAQIFGAALPEAALAPINTIADKAIPDVSMTASYANAVYRLYRAGILEGYEGGAYHPNDNIRRSEMAALLTRIADPSLRIEFTLNAQSAELNAQQISEKCANAVFYIEIYDRYDSVIATGSGFFIDSDGTAITNYHVIENAYDAYVLLANGDIHHVAGICDYSYENDLALIKVDGSGFDYLEPDTAALTAGQHVFAIGSPQGLDNTISEGIVSNPHRYLDGIDYIQITAPISHGSSGGALLNAQGRVIGVTSAGFDGGQNLNLAIPIALTQNLSRYGLLTLEQFQNAGVRGDGQGVLEVESSSMALSQGASAIQWVTANTEEDVFVRYDLSRNDIISCSWGEWINYSELPLYITANNAGTVTVTLSLILNDGSDKVLDTITFTVTVSGEAFYSNFYPLVPDYGAFMGVQVSQIIPQNGGVLYAYDLFELIDIYGEDDETVLLNYVDLLERYGYSFSSTKDFGSDEFVWIFDSVTGSQVQFGIESDEYGNPYVVVILFD